MIVYWVFDAAPMPFDNDDGINEGVVYALGALIFENKLQTVNKIQTKTMPYYTKLIIYLE